MRGFDPLAHFDEKLADAYDRFSQFAVIASRQAVADAGLDLDGELAERTAVITGTGIGGANTIDSSSARLYRDGHRRVHPNTIPKLMPSAASSHITLEHGITGPSFSVTSACSSATHAIGEAFWMIRTGRARAAITGGSEAPLTYGSLPCWQALRVMDPETCRPFDRRRRGMVLGEGAGMLVLEEMEAAKHRGARIYGELAGFGLSADAESILEPSERGAVRCLRAVLEDAGLAPQDVDYINAHGTGTQANDVNETNAIRQVFGSCAGELMISSTKSMHGHALGAAGALELVLTVQAMACGIAPPTATLEEPDPACDLDYVPKTARERPVRAALSNSFAFGGLNAALAIRRLD